MSRTTCLILFGVAMLAGCFGGGGADPMPASAEIGSYEISDQPRLLLDPSAPIEKLTLRGVALGAARAQIPVGKIIAQDHNGWIVTRGGYRYRVVNGIVVTLGVWDEKLLRQLGVNEEADIERVFGKAQDIEKVDSIRTQMTIYRYSDGQRRVSWDRIMNKLVAVNIGSPAATTLPQATQPAKNE